MSLPFLLTMLLLAAISSQTVLTSTLKLMLLIAPTLSIPRVSVLPGRAYILVVLLTSQFVSTFSPAFLLIMSLALPLTITWTSAATMVPVFLTPTSLMAAMYSVTLAELLSVPLLVLRLVSPSYSTTLLILAARVSHALVLLYSAESFL